MSLKRVILSERSERRISFPQAKNEMLRYRSA
jgi:hypothetical protein